MPVTSEEFRHALGRFASGVTVVTTAHNNQYNGLTVSAFCSVSLNPPLVLICIDKQSTANETIQASRVFAVNLLAEGQEGLSNHFAKKNPDKFHGLDYDLGKLGLPLLRDSLGYLECSLSQTIDGGDHYVYIAQVEHARTHDDAKPLVYYTGAYRQLTT